MRRARVNNVIAKILKDDKKYLIMPPFNRSIKW